MNRNMKAGRNCWSMNRETKWMKKKNRVAEDSKGGILNEVKKWLVDKQEVTEDRISKMGKKMRYGKEKLIDEYRQWM